jgi:hypothetical protein
MAQRRERIHNRGESLSDIILPKIEQLLGSLHNFLIANDDHTIRVIDFISKKGLPQVLQDQYTLVLLQSMLHLIFSLNHLLYVLFQHLLL